MLFRRPYKVRRAARSGKEITIAPEAKIDVGESVVQFYDGFVLIVPMGAEVHEQLLQHAIVLKEEREEVAEPRH